MNEEDRQGIEAALRKWLETVAQLDRAQRERRKRAPYRRDEDEEPLWVAAARSVAEKERQMAPDVDDEKRRRVAPEEKRDRVKR